jgi:hypothetical protein
MTHSRRVFLGSAAAGLGAIAIPTRLDGVSLLAHPGEDPMLAEILRQLRQAARAVQAAPDGAAIRQMAWSTRMAAAWGRANGLDDRVRAALHERLSAADGRDAMLHRQVDFRADARRRGEEPPPALVARATRIDRARALDELLANGVTRRFDALAATMDHAAARLDRQSDPVLRVALGQDDCSLAQDFLVFLECMLQFFEAIGDNEMWFIVWLELLGWLQVVAWLC